MSRIAGYASIAVLTLATVMDAAPASAAYRGGCRQGEKLVGKECIPSARFLKPCPGTRLPDGQCITANPNAGAQQHPNNVNPNGPPNAHTAGPPPHLGPPPGWKPPAPSN